MSQGVQWSWVEPDKENCCYREKEDWPKFYTYETLKVFKGAWEKEIWGKRDLDEELRNWKREKWEVKVISRIIMKENQGFKELN